MSTIDTKSINTIRALSADMIEKAKSGHPGTPLGAAPTAYALWDRLLHTTPIDSQWVNRDRFILSAGHASALLYSLLHIYGYDVSMDDLKQFRQLHSKTPGHPEYGHTDGVEATTGPLGTGLGMAVGMAMAQAHLASIFNKEGYPLFDHHVYALCGDGCLMEGISSEVLSLAGNLKLDKLVILYDNNHISIEGNTKITFTEDVPAKMAALGFRVIKVAQGDDFDAVLAALEEAQTPCDRPTFVEIKTEIGAHSPKEGSEASHGAPLGEDNVRALKENLGFNPDDHFFCDQDVYDHAKARNEREKAYYDKWQNMFNDYMQAYPAMKALWDQYFQPDFKAYFNDDYYTITHDQPVATRNISGEVLNGLAKAYPSIWGGSADLGSSVKSYLNGEEDFDSTHYEGRNIHYGVRENGMAAIANGITLYGGSRTYVSTFFTFSDFLKPIARMSALMRIPTLYIFSHDSIGVGEDGPTHQPVEQLTMLRSIPHFDVWRPCDEMETKVAYEAAFTQDDHPTAIILSRQNLALVAGSQEAAKGGYILKDCEGTPDVIVMASGSEVSLAVAAASEANVKVRVVSMPSIDVFKRQSKDYITSVLPDEVENRIAVEAGSRMSWGEFVGYKGQYLTVDDFGTSAPADEVFKEKGFTVEHLKEMIENF